MVDFLNNAGEGEDVDLEQTINDAWKQMLTSQTAATVFINESQKKAIGGENGQLSFFNNKLVSSLGLKLGCS